MPEHHSANVSEIFSSIQGEGLYVGRRQVFVRFRGCNLRCRYCDTPDSRGDGPCRVEIEPGSGRFKTLRNPVDSDALLSAVGGLAGRVRHHSISLTGGEPLLHAGFLRQWLPRLPGGQQVHLETNGSLPEELEQVVNLVDVVAMDVKLPSMTGLEPCYGAHLLSLQAAAGRQVFVKVVFGEATPDSELDEVARIVARVDPVLPVVLQPVTGEARPGALRILSAQEYLSRKLANVLVIPQTHKAMGCA